MFNKSIANPAMMQTQKQKLSEADRSTSHVQLGTNSDLWDRQEEKVGRHRARVVKI